MLSYITFAALFAATSAINVDNEVPLKSGLGGKLISKARKLDGANAYYEEDFTWIAGYSLKFDRCHSIHLYDEGAGDKEEGDGSPFGVQQLVSFRLCPNGSSCSKSGEYVVQLRDFVESYMDAKLELEEAQCETVAVTDRNVSFLDLFSLCCSVM